MRDSHGRGLRRPLMPPSLPGYQSRSQRFDAAVAAAAVRLQRVSPKVMRGVEIAVELVPASDPAPWEDGVPVGRLFPAGDGQATRIVLYRKPLEARAEGPIEVVIRDVLVDHLSHHTGVAPHDIDPDYGAEGRG